MNTSIIYSIKFIFFSFPIYTFTWAQINEAIAYVHPILFSCIDIFHIHKCFSIARLNIVFIKKDHFI